MTNPICHISGLNSGKVHQREFQRGELKTSPWLSWKTARDMTKVSQGFRHHINQIQSGVVDYKYTDTERYEHRHEKLGQPQ